MERRIIARKSAIASVYLSCPGQALRRCRTTNVSAHGVFVEANLLRLTRGVTVELIFVLSYGSIIKLHRRRARVSHVSRRGAGLMLVSNRHSPVNSSSSRVST